MMYLSIIQNEYHRFKSKSKNIRHQRKVFAMIEIVNFSKEWSWFTSMYIKTTRKMRRKKATIFCLRFYIPRLHANNFNWFHFNYTKIKWTFHNFALYDLYERWININIISFVCSAPVENKSFSIIFLFSIRKMRCLLDTICLCILWFDFNFLFYILFNLTHTHKVHWRDRQKWLRKTLKRNYFADFEEISLCLVCFLCTVKSKIFNFNCD